MGLSGARPQARRAAGGFASGLRSTGRAGASTARGTGRVIRRMTQASGAGRTGLDRVIELTAAGAAADAFVAVALAGTLFFSTSVDQARGRIALTLLITMAPFAVLAPFIGPMLDRVQDGRRYIMVGTLLARGLLCWGMSGAVQHSDTVTLLPAAFGVLVLQKAYGVTRSSVTPRVLPARITLVSANARISLAALIASTVGVGVAGGVSFLAGRRHRRGDLGAARRHPGLPGRHRTGDQAAHPGGPSSAAAAPDPAAGPGREPAGRRQAAAGPPGPRRAAAGRRGETRTGQGSGPRRARWAATLRSVGPIVGEAMRGNAALRAFSGYMIFFLAFLLRTVHFPGTSDKLALGAMIAAAGAGGFIGTGIGALLKARAPHLILFVLLCASTAITAACAAFFGLWAALVVALVAAFSQVLAKLALDSIVQREVPEEIRSSTLAASETIHQLAWVAGGLAGLAMSITDSGVAGLAVPAAGLAATAVLLLASRRRRILAARAAAARAAPPPVIPVDTCPWRPFSTGIRNPSRHRPEGVGRRETGGAHGGVDPGRHAHRDRHRQAAPGRRGRDDHRLPRADRVPEGGTRAEQHAAQPAQRGQQRRLGQELRGHVPPRGAERTAQADLGPPFQHGDDHDVGDADPADAHGDPAEGEEQAGERGPGLRPRGEHLGRLADLDALGQGRVRGERQHRRHRLHLIGLGPQVDLGGVAAQAEPGVRDREADQRGLVDLRGERHRAQHADHREVLAAHVDQGAGAVPG